MNINELNLIPLPDAVKEICKKVNAPPRLIAHLTLVHDVAVKLTKEIKTKFPMIEINEQSIHFGAATHDIGKAIHRSELSGSGSRHEEDGADLLKSFDVSVELARFTRTHALWRTDSSLELEDLLVSLADNCWKGKREVDLEMLICNQIACVTKKEIWDVFIVLDEILQTITIESDARLAWQQQYPI